MEIVSKVTIVLISYYSYNKIHKFLKKIPTKIPVIVLENSKDKNIRKLKKKFKNVKLFYKNNDGYGASINYASKIIKTTYFFVVQPDIQGININSIKNFIRYAKKIKNNFSVIGPHFTNATKSGHYQTDLKHRIKEIHNVHGSALFFNLKNYRLLKGFDSNFFLYWEETDFTKRSWQKKIPVYQLNLVKVKHEKGLSVETSSQIEKNNIRHLYIWHFIWSKYYFYKKHYGKIFSLIYCFPIFLRCLIKMTFYSLSIKKKEEFYRYYFRLHGLLSSIKEKKSFFRIEDIKKFKLNY